MVTLSRLFPLLTEIILEEEASSPSIWLPSNIVHIEKEE